MKLWLINSVVNGGHQFVFAILNRSNGSCKCILRSNGYLSKYPKSIGVLNWVLYWWLLILSYLMWLNWMYVCISIVVFFDYFPAHKHWQLSSSILWIVINSFSFYSFIHFFLCSIHSLNTEFVPIHCSHHHPHHHNQHPILSGVLWCES